MLRVPSSMMRPASTEVCKYEIRCIFLLVSLKGRLRDADIVQFDVSV